jgi:hypothetical protein
MTMKQSLEKFIEFYIEYRTIMFNTNKISIFKRNKENVSSNEMHIMT